MRSISFVLGVLIAGSFAQQATQSDAGIIVSDWTFRHDIFGNPVAVILKDDMNGIGSPLKSRILALLGPLTLSPEFFGTILRSDLGRELNEPLPDLSGTEAWSRMCCLSSLSPNHVRTMWIFSQG